MIHTVFYSFGLSGIGFTASNVYPDITDVDEMITGRRREGVIATFNTFIKKIASGVIGMAVLTGLEWFGVRTVDSASSTQIVGSIGKGHHAYELFGSAFNSSFGIKFFAAFVPIVFIIFCLVSLNRFTMTKTDHQMIRAAIAVKKKYGAVSLSEEQIKKCEQIAGQRREDMWLFKNESNAEPHSLETDENGVYTVLK